MDETAILDRLQILARQIFRQPGLVIDRTTRASDVEGWDSLAHARLMLAVEERFDVALPSERLFDLDAVGDLVTLLATLTAGRS